MAPPCVHNTACLMKKLYTYRDCASADMERGPRTYIIELWHDTVRAGHGRASTCQAHTEVVRLGGLNDLTRALERGVDSTSQDSPGAHRSVGSELAVPHVDPARPLDKDRASHLCQQRGLSILPRKIPPPVQRLITQFVPGLQCW